MKSIAHTEFLHHKRAECQIGGKAKQRAIPFFVGDVYLSEHKKPYHKCCGDAVMKQSRNGWQIENSCSLSNVGRIYTARNAAKYSKKPNKMKNVIITFSKQNCKRQYKARHTAKAVRNDEIPSDRVVSEDLRKSVCDNSNKKQYRYSLKKDLLTFFCFGIFLCQKKRGT